MFSTLPTKIQGNYIVFDLRGNIYGQQKQEMIDEMITLCSDFPQSVHTVLVEVG